MNTFEKSVSVLQELFGKDYLFCLATCSNNVPSVRFIDTFYDDGAFYIVTYAKSQKVIELEQNPDVALTNELYRFTGKAYNLGHPLKESNKEMRDKLIKVFEPWYFAHNNEDDENMCYVKVVPETGFFYKDGTGYKVDFAKKEADEFPFSSDIG